MKTFNFKSANINFQENGTGNTIIFLHGYLENQSIWNEYSSQLSKKFKVVTLDLPGHGKSACGLEVISMDFMADSVNALMNTLGIQKSILVGHSMGGYAALAFAEHYSDRLAGLCLFHSNPNADSGEKKNSRMNDIDLVNHGQSDVIINRSIPNLFANYNLEKFKIEIENLVNIAKYTPDKGIIGALSGMADRPDRNAIFENLKCPTMMIFGNNDNLIPLNTAELLAKRHKKTRTVFLENSGHMGFIEEKDQALKAITSFVNDVFL